MLNYSNNVACYLQMSQGEGTEGLQVITSVTGQTDGMQVATVTTDNGEVLHIQQADQNTEWCQHWRIKYCTVSYYRGMLWGSKYDKIKIVKIKAKFYMKMLWEFDYDTEKYLCTFFWGSNLRNFYTLQNSLLYDITQYYSLLY